MNKPDKAVVCVAVFFLALIVTWMCKQADSLAEALHILLLLPALPFFLVLSACDSLPVVYGSAILGWLLILGLVVFSGRGAVRTAFYLVFPAWVMLLVIAVLTWHPAHT